MKLASNELTIVSVNVNDVTDESKRFAFFEFLNLMGWEIDKTLQSHWPKP
jgi:hypothetical protein